MMARVGARPAGNFGRMLGGHGQRKYDFATRNLRMPKDRFQYVALSDATDVRSRVSRQIDLPGWLPAAVLVMVPSPQAPPHWKELGIPKLTLFAD